MTNTSPHLKEIFNSGKGKKAWDAECKRWNKLTEQQRQAEYTEYKAKQDEFWAQMEQKRKEGKKEAWSRDLKLAEYTYVNHENPHTLENGEATAIWLLIMIVATIFKGNWLIWIMATVVYVSHILRHQTKQREWQQTGRDKWEEKYNKYYGGK